MAIFPAKYTKGVKASPEYPYGSSGANVTDKGGNTTPVPREWWDEVFGFLQALLGSAGIVPSGNVETALISQYVQAIDTLIANATANVLKYSGGYNATTNTPNLTTPVAGTILQGNTYTVETGHASNFFGIELEQFDMLVAEIDDPSVAGDWTVVQANLNPTTIKTMYESNEDTNEYSDAEQTIVNYLTVTAATDVDAMRAASHTHANKATLDLVTAAFTSELKTQYDANEPNSPDATDPEVVAGTEGAQRDFSPAQLKLASQTFAIPNFTQAKNIYIDKAGNDSNQGSVSKPFLTLTAAIAYINTQSPTNINKFNIVMGAGSYTENPITVPRGTSIFGQGRSTLLSASDTTNHFLTLQSFSIIQSVEIQNVITLDKYCINVNGDSSSRCFIRDCHFENASGAIRSGSASGQHNLFINNCRMQALTATAINTANDSNTFINGIYAQNVNKIIETNDTSDTYVDDVFAGGTINTAIHRIAGGPLHITNSDLVNSTINVQRELATGGIFYLNTKLDQTKIVDLPPYGFPNTQGLFHDGIDTQIFNNVSIGSPNLGRKTYIGEGAPFIKDGQGWTYNGSVYANPQFVPGLQNIFNDQSGAAGAFTFPNISINSAIYIGHPTMPFNALELFMEGTNPADIYDTGGIPGEIIAEYWDGALWVEFNCLNTLQDSPYTSAAKEYFNRWTDNENIRFDKNILTNWTPNQPDSAEITPIMPTAYWVRFRIIATLAVTPRISNFTLIRNATEISEEGFIQYFGEARAYSILPIFTGTFTPKDANPGDREIAIGSNFDLKALKHSFKGGVASRLTGIVQLPSNIDTSSFLKAQFHFSPRGNGGGNGVFVLRLATSKPGDLVYDTTGAAPVVAPNEKSYTVVTPIPAVLFEQFAVKFDNIDLSEIIPNDGSGNIEFLWISIERTGNDGADTNNNDTTLIQAAFEYLKWNNGGQS